jgi:beta-galactosidase
LRVGLLALGACGGRDPDDPSAADAGGHSTADAVADLTPADAMADGGGAVDAGPPYVPVASPREDLLIDDGWRFLPGDVAGAETPTFEDAGWAAVQIPHTWNVEDGQDGGNDFHRGIGWYRRHLVVPASGAGRRFFLQFDAASVIADVFLNGVHLGQHRGGFATFRFDVTAALRPGGDNVIAVKVSNAFAPDVPPLSGDFTVFGGLYRDVHLVAVDPVHIALDDFGSQGVYVTPTNVSAATADLEVRVKLRNASTTARDVEARALVLRADHTVAATLLGSATLGAGGAGDVRLTGSIDRPHLWDGRRDPYLYAVTVELREDGMVRDLVTVPLGFRSYAVTPDRGFSLNGQPLDIRGVLRHQDREGKGWAVSDADLDEDVELITGMGANAVRLIHYQHARHFYDLCDRAGLAVWTEIGLVNAVTHSDAFTANARQQLTELIRQNHNHPSIFFWGLANELVDFDSAAPFPLLAELNDLAHAEDPSRTTSLASHVPDSFAINGQTDVVGFNKYYGWYYGALTDLGPWADMTHALYPQRRIALSEYGAGASVKFHSATPKAGDHTEEYQAIYHETSWKALATRPFLWGKFITFIFDLASDGRNEGDSAGRNDKGLVTYDRKTKKDAYYFYQAAWSPSPMVHIAGRRFDPRTDATTDIKVYANTSTVALSVNGRALGEKTSADHVFVWPGVTLERGANHVEALGKIDGATISDSVSWTLAAGGDGGAPDGRPPAMLSGPCNDLVDDAPGVAFESGGAIPEMTGGTIVDGTYVLTKLWNSPRAGVGHMKLRISGGGAIVDLSQRVEGGPLQLGAGTMWTAGNYLTRSLTCPGPVTFIDKYTASPTTITIQSSQGPVSVFTRE